MGQIALQHAYGDGMEESCERTVEAVSNLFYGIPVHGYLAMNMDAIIPINDAVGGVDVVIGEGDENIEITSGNKRLYRAGWKAGETVHLEGVEAYSFVRNRDMYAPHSAEQRLERQKRYLEAFAAQAKKAVAQDLTLPAKLYGRFCPTWSRIFPLPKRSIWPPRPFPIPSPGRICIRCREKSGWANSLKNSIRMKRPCTS